ncbi:MAG: hypothetical protein ABI960_07450, partial [Candidatus Eisenbacteria bacterium]
MSSRASSRPFAGARFLVAALAVAAFAGRTAPARAAWSVDGNPLTLAGGHQSIPLAAPDAQGGAYVVWLDYRSGNADLYAQHISATSALVAGWPSNGLAVCTLPSVQHDPAIASDGAGGACVVWTDARNGSQDIFALRLVSGGVAPGWPA